MRKSYKKDSVLLVKWLDTVVKSQWFKENEAKRAGGANCSTVGFYLNQTGTLLRLSSSIGEDKDRDVTVIPLGCIKKVTILKVL